MRTQLGRSAVVLLAGYVALLVSAYLASLVTWPLWAESLLFSGVFLCLLYGLGAVAFDMLMKHGRLNTRPIGPHSRGPLAGYVSMLLGWCVAVAMVFWWLPRVSDDWLLVVSTVAVVGLVVILHFAELSSSGEAHAASE